MAEEKAKTTSDQVMFEKIGGGSFDMIRRSGKKKRIKPGQRFRAYLDEIPEGFKDVCVPVNVNELKAAEEKIAGDVVNATYTVKHRGRGWYNVVDKNGEIVNEKALKKADAEALISSLT